MWSTGAGSKTCGQNAAVRGGARLDAIVQNVAICSAGTRTASRRAIAMHEIGTHDARRDRKLPHMAHRVFRTVHQAANYCRRKLRTPDTTPFAQDARIDCAQLPNRRTDPLIELLQHRGNIGLGTHLALRAERRELCLG